MASPTKVHKARKRLKKAKRGLVRKNVIRRDGTTAKNLPLNMPNANEVAQIKLKQAKA